MITFTNSTTKETYQNNKKYITFESVPNTAAGYERCRTYIISHGTRYFLSANTEKDYYMNFEDKSAANDSFSVWFSIDGDKVTIHKAIYRNRIETADRYLKKYMMVLSLAHSCIKYDKIVEYIRYTA